LRRFVQADERDRRVWHDCAALIDDRDDRAGAGIRLRMKRECGEKKQGDSDQSLQTRFERTTHLRTSNFLESIFVLTLNRSTVVSSVVSAPVARRSRNGHCIPSTSR